MTLKPIEHQPQFRPCAACGNLIPVSSIDCQYCGAVSAEAVAAARQAQVNRAFIEALFKRQTPFTMIVLGANLAVFLLEWLAGGMGAMSADQRVLVGFGAKVNSLIVGQHQYWRLITCVFLHIGFIHFLMNNYVLWIIGREVEQIYGSARFVILYIVTGVIASTCSLFFSASTSAGASGAIFGLFGVMATFAFRHRGEIPSLLGNEIRRKVIPVIGLNLLFGFTARGIVDNSAHLGGLIAGILLALIVPFQRPEEVKTPLLLRGLQVVCLLLVFASFVAAFANYNGPALRAANLTARTGAEPLAYFDGMKAADDSFRDSMTSLSRTPARDEISQPLEKALEAANTGLRRAQQIPTTNGQGGTFKTQIIDLLSRQKKIVERYREGGAAYRPQAIKEIEALDEAHTQFLSELNPWLRRYMKENGYELKSEPDN